MPVEQDRYDRLVAVVYAGGASVNEDMIAQGFAWAYRGYLGQVPGDEHYCELEAQARAARRGLWSQPAELWVPPWIWRERQRAGPGAKVPAEDYAGETVEKCVAEIKQSRLASLPQGADRGQRGGGRCGSLIPNLHQSWAFECGLAIAPMADFGHATGQSETRARYQPADRHPAGPAGAAGFGPGGAVRRIDKAL
jgi:hypothetical protein